MDCTRPEFLIATVVTGDAITAGSDLSYVPRKQGESDLSLETKDAFGEAHTGTTRKIIVDGILVSVSPDISSAEPGDRVDLTATVANALSQTVKWMTTEGSIFETGENTATLITPDDPWSEPIKVTARSTANTGPREGMVDSDPRDGFAFVNVKSVTVTVSPSDICLKPGEQQTFSASVTGTVDHAVTWSIQPPGAGTLVGSTYTAPGTFQDVSIIAESVDDPTAKGFASVEVSNCKCKWDATLPELLAGRRRARMPYASSRRGCFSNQRRVAVRRPSA